MREPRTFEEALDRIADLEEEIVTLKTDMARVSDIDRMAHYRARWGLTKKECALLDCLYSRSGLCATRDAIMDALYGNIDDEPETKTIDVFISKIRFKIGRDAISCVWGAGYRLNPAALAEVSDVIATPIDQITPMNDRHPGRSTGLHRSIRAALVAGPMTAREIARIAGRSYNVTCSTLGWMRKQGHAVKSGGNPIQGAAVWRLTERGRSIARDDEKGFGKGVFTGAAA